MTPSIIQQILGGVIGFMLGAALFGAIIGAVNGTRDTADEIIMTEKCTPNPSLWECQLYLAKVRE